MCAGRWATGTVLFASRILLPAGSPSPPASLSFSSSSVKRSRACASVHGEAARVLQLVQNAPMSGFPQQVGVFPLLSRVPADSSATSGSALHTSLMGVGGRGAEGSQAASDSGAAEAATWPDGGGSERSARRRGDLASKSKGSKQAPVSEEHRDKPPLTVNVAVEGHHARPLRAAEGRVMELVGQGGGYPGLRVTLGSPAMLRRVLFMSCSAVLKPHL